ncbi:MAG: acetyl-CoA carboxylase biotin carboxyl carrier protein [Candidatus Omnitrophica bacterium]|nr:acetyl-CoA carboxylase biotin carboxyl carrier protein [Candidatus Omnitrophota bacterium]
MNLKEIKELIELMNENELSEFEMEKNGIKIKLVKGKMSGAPHIAVEAASLPAAHPEGPTQTSQPQETSAHTVEIKSPMVGTFYRAPAPDAPPFVETGQDVDVGQSVCIIEAMKLMNEVKSDYKGKIVKLLVENGEPVEYNQPLFLIQLP